MDLNLHWERFLFNGGGGEDYALNSGDREFPVGGAATSSGEHPHATGVSTAKDVGGESPRGEQLHTSTNRAAERSKGEPLDSPAADQEGEVVKPQVGIEHSHLSDDHTLLEAFLELMRRCELRYGQPAMQIWVQRELSAGASGIVNGIMRMISVDWKDESPRMTPLGRAGEPPLVGVVLDVSQPPLEGEALTARVYPGNDIASVIGNDAPGNDGSSVSVDGQVGNDAHG